MSTLNRGEERKVIFFVLLMHNSSCYKPLSSPNTYWSLASFTLSYLFSLFLTNFYCSFSLPVLLLSSLSLPHSLRCSISPFPCRELYLRFSLSKSSRCTALRRFRKMRRDVKYCRATLKKMRRLFTEPLMSFERQLNSQRL